MSVYNSGSRFNVDQRSERHLIENLLEYYYINYSRKFLGITIRWPQIV